MSNYSESKSTHVSRLRHLPLFGDFCLPFPGLVEVGVAGPDDVAGNAVLVVTFAHFISFDFKHPSDKLSPGNSGTLDKSSKMNQLNLLLRIQKSIVSRLLRLLNV